MYAVLAEGAIYYLGNCRDTALGVLESKDGATLSNISTLNGLAAAFEACSKPECTEEDAPSRLDEVLRKLDDIDLNGNTEEVLNRVREGGEKLIGQVRSLGLRGMKATGEGLAAIGDLLQQASAEEESSEGNPLDETTKEVEP